MNDDSLARLRIASSRKRRSQGTLWLIIFGVLAASAAAVYFAYPRSGDSDRSGLKSGRNASGTKSDPSAGSAAKNGDSENGIRNRGTVASSGQPGSRSSTSSTAAGMKADGSILTVSGYIVARERIELSPRFLGVVTWIGVKKGDVVTNGQVVVRLDDAEYRARLSEVDAQIAVSQVGVERSRVDLKRAQELVSSRVEMQKLLDDARLAMAAAEAQYQHSVAGRQLIKTYMEWCVIRSPVDGVVLEKLVDPNELVTPQTFGNGRGPSTSLIAVADLTDLQVEVDIGESALGKVRLGQQCIVNPEAYPDREYQGVVAEMAPEANRAKGTLAVKVKIQNPDKYLTPELSARVRFLGEKSLP